MAGTWRYVRGADSIEVRRWDCDVGGRLVIMDKGERAEETFDDIAEVIDAQRRLEATLRDAGWALLDFFPERRTGFDRRAASRQPDRRKSSRPPRR